MIEKKDLFWQLVTRLSLTDKQRLCSDYEQFLKHHYQKAFYQRLSYAIYNMTNIHASYKVSILHHCQEQQFSWTTSLPLDFLQFLSGFSNAQWLNTFGYSPEDEESTSTDTCMEVFAQWVESQRWDPAIMMQVHGLVGRIFLQSGVTDVTCMYGSADYVNDSVFDSVNDEEDFSDQDERNWDEVDDEVYDEVDEEPPEDKNQTVDYISNQSHYLPANALQLFSRAVRSES